MATRSSSNQGVSKNKTNGSSYSTGRNPGGMVAGLTAGTTYGEGKSLKEQVSAAPLSKEAVAQRPAPARTMPQMDVFAGTQRPSEPVTSGLPFGPGAGQTEPLENTNDIIYEMYRLTGDSYLLNLIDQ